MKVILCGYHWSGCKALSILNDAGHDIFVCTHDNPYHVPSLKNYASMLQVPWSTDDISTGELPFAPDIICSVFYRYIIKKHVIEACRSNIFNLHPSLLPKYRGCSSLAWAMIKGDTETGFTFHYIDEGCDTGNVIVQCSVKIEPWDTQETLYLRVMTAAMKRFQEAFDIVVSGNKGRVQEGESSYFARGCPYDGIINPDWTRDFKERFIRAMIYPPYPVAKYRNQNIYSMTELEAAEKSNTNMIVGHRE